MTSDRAMQLINILLRGYVPEYEECYLDDDSPDDKRARAALAGLLRSGKPLTQDLRDALANLFDPEDITHHGEKRRLKFEHRSAGTPPSTVLHSCVAQDIYDAVKQGATTASAKESAEDKYGLGKENIKKIWQAYKPALEDMFGQLPPPRRGRRKAPK